MKTLKFDSKDEWFFGRLGKITGSRLSEIIPKRNKNEKKKGYYKIIAERMGVPEDGENPMERGSRLETEAIERFKLETGKEVASGFITWMREDEPDIAVSPDGVVSETEAVEVKCLSSASHIEAYLTKAIPDEYLMQAIQYFVVNDALETLYFTFYDPRFTMFAPGGELRKTGTSSLDFFVIEMKREDVAEEVADYLAYQRTILKEVRDIVNQLTF